MEIFFLFRNTQFVCFFCVAVQVKQPGLEERAHTIGHTARSSPVSFGNQAPKTMSLPQVSTLENSYTHIFISMYI